MQDQMQSQQVGRPMTRPERGPGNPIIEKVVNLVDILKTTVEGVYYDNQLEKLGISPDDPQVMQKLEQRMTQMQQTDVQDGFTSNPSGQQKLSDTQNRQMMLQNTQRLMQHYAKRQGQSQAIDQSIDFFKR